MCVGWTITGDFDDYSFGVRARKVIVTYATRFRVHASRGKRLQRLGIEMIAIAEVPLPRNNCCYAIVPVRMCLDRGVRGNEQQNRVKVRS